ncbi:MAG: heme ABC transporter permease [Proteobacteria bacterium]|nr:heme ABC transporter permease [Pseudomonadota bacterium]
MFGLANPQRFMDATRRLPAVLGVVAGLLLAAGVWLSFTAPPDYQQGETVRIMFIHVPAAWMSLFVYVCLGGSAFFGVVFRHALADAAARAAAPLGAGFTALALATGSLWGRPMWGTWWVNDARLVSVLILFLFYLGYMALQASIDDEQKAARASGVLALVGLVNVPIVHFSVNWWNSLHQDASVFRIGGPTISWPILAPLLVMALGYTVLFLALWIVRIRTEVTRRRALSLALKAAGAA